MRAKRPFRRRLQMKAIILAGGAGTRLRSLVPDLPKPMAPIAGRPFLEYLIERLVQGGVTDLVLSVGHRADAISDHFGGSWGGAAISYAVETEPLGTGGAIAFAAQGCTDNSILVVNGDTYLGINFADLVAWGGSKPALTAGMVLRAVEDVARYGAVLCADGMVQGFVEKGETGPGLVNAGVYLLNPEIFSQFGLSGRFSLESDLLQPHAEALPLRAYVTDGFFVDIGVPADYLLAQIAIPAHVEDNLFRR